jgi:Fe-coproporphyrin III synthase
VGSKGEVTGRSGFLPDRIVHLHPTRLCNLACLHCYSTSAPSFTEALDARPAV